MNGKRIPVALAAALVAAVLIVAPAPVALAAPPQPADCSNESYNLLASKNCGIEGAVPDTYWETTYGSATIERSAEQTHNGAYAMKVTGSALWSNSYSAGAQTIKTSNPIGVTGSTGYSAVGWVYIPSTASRVGLARLRVAWYSAADCTGSAISSHDADITATGTWAYAWRYVTSPASAQCAQLRLLIQTPASGSGDVGPVFFDNVMLYRSSSNAITLRDLAARAPLSPWAGLPVAGLVAAGGAVAWRRRKPDAERKPYEPPTVAYEAPLEIRAGSPLRIPFDPINLTNSGEVK